MIMIIQMQTKRIKTRKLTTWNTKYCCEFMKYGSSLYPPIGSFLLTQIPAITITVDLAMKNEYILMGFHIFLQVVVNVAMFTILCTDPGILPQIIYRYETHEQLFDIPCRAFEQEHKYLLPTRSLLHHQKYCPECNIYRPIRSIHCGSCNHCVERYDHHCPWLAICIGKNNYKYFIFYLSSLVAIIIYTFGIGLSFIINNIMTQKWPGDYIPVILVTVFTGIFLLPVGRLLVYHLGLIRKGISTNQDLRKTYKIINNALPYIRVECSMINKDRYPFVSEYHYLKGRRKFDKSTALEDSMDGPLNRKNQSILNSLIKNQHL